MTSLTNLEREALNRFVAIVAVRAWRDALMRQVTAGADGTTRSVSRTNCYWHKDALGPTRIVTDASGASSAKSMDALRGKEIRFMRGYADITRSTSACVHFVEAHEVDSDLPALRAQLDELRVKCAYVDCRQWVPHPDALCDAIALAIGAEHAPYGEEHWVRLFDDMISLSTELSGLVIVLDHADEMYQADRSKIFNVVEAFLVPFHHWLDRRKPCHLCFQMSPHPLVALTFERPRNH